MPDLEYRLVAKEPIVLVLPSDHRLASRRAIAIKDIAEKTFIGMSKTAPTLQVIIDDYFKRSGVAIRTAHQIDNLAMAMSLVASTRGVTLLPAYAQNFLPWSVISRPLAGEAPTIDLVIGYNKANTSAILKLFLARSDELISRGENKLPHGRGYGAMTCRLGWSSLLWWIIFLRSCRLPVEPGGAITAKQGRECGGRRGERGFMTLWAG